MVLKRYCCYVIFLLVFAGGTGTAQQEYGYSADSENKFSAALQAFHGQHFSDAAAQFEALARLPVPHQRTTASYVMAATSYFELRGYTSSIVLLQEMLRAYSFTQYRSEALYMLGANLMMLQKYEEASSYFLEAISVASDPNIRAQASQLFADIAEERLTANNLQQLLAARHDVHTINFVTMMLAEKYYRAGDRRRADEIFQQLSNIDTRDPLFQRVTRLRDQAAAQATLNIGVLLPLQQNSLSSGRSLLSEEVLAGIQFALDERNARGRARTQVLLKIIDTGQDSVNALRSVRDLAEAKDVVAVVGPLFSNLAALYAPIINAANVPMISPTATGEGLAATGSYVFQANPDYTTRGKAMARNAVQEMGYTQLAVLTSTEANAKTFAEAFASEAKALGATIVAYETYGKDSPDLHDQFMDIRKAGVSQGSRVWFGEKLTRQDIQAILRAGANREIFNEMRKKHESAEVTALFGPRGARIADSLHLKVYTPAAQAQTIDIPVTAIQALCIPVGSSDEIGVVASQLSYFNIKAQILGSGEWNAPNELEAHKRYINGAIFIADSYEDEEDSAYVRFKHSFVSQTGKNPGKNTLYGYDTMKMLLEEIDRGATTRDQLALSLASLKKYPGVHASISFEHRRVNSFVHILQYHNGTITNIAEVSAY